MRPIQVHVAGWHEKVSVNEIDNAIRQIRREVRPEIQTAVFSQSPRHVHPRIFLAQRELYIRIRFVVAQQNVVARLLLLDEVVFERQRFFFIGDDDPFHIDGLADQRPSLGIGGTTFVEVLADAVAQALGFTHVDDHTLGIAVEVDARGGGNRPDFGEQIHSPSRSTRKFDDDDEAGVQPYFKPASEDSLRPPCRGRSGSSRA